MKLQLAFDEKPRGGGGIGATTQIEKVLHQNGIEFTTMLYDEALDLASRGNFYAASECLRMLLCLNPRDGASHLLLAKTLAAQKKWQEAMSFLKKSEEHGMHIPSTIHNFIEQGLQRELHNSDIERKRALKRDRSELNQLKNEMRKLRSHNSSQKKENKMLAELLRKWTLIFIGVTGSAMAIIVFLLLGGNKSTPVQDENTDQQVTTSTDLEAPQEQDRANPEAEAQPQPENQAQPTPTPKVEPKVEPKPVPPKPKPVQASPKFPKQHKVRSGETLEKIATQYYGKGHKWKQIASHNKIDPSKLRAGAIIEIPAPK